MQSGNSFQLCLMRKIHSGYMRTALEVKDSDVQRIVNKCSNDGYSNKKHMGGKLPLPNYQFSAIYEQIKASGLHYQNTCECI